MSSKNLVIGAVSLNSKIENTSHRQYCTASQGLYNDIWVFGAIFNLQNKVCNLYQVYYRTYGRVARYRT